MRQKLKKKQKIVYRTEPNIRKLMMEKEPRKKPISFIAVTLEDISRESILILPVGHDDRAQNCSKLESVICWRHADNCCGIFQLKMVLIKCCDISNEVRPFEVSEPWVDCLLEEYFNQVGAVWAIFGVSVSIAIEFGWYKCTADETKCNI